MELSTITEEPEVAKQLFEEYRDEVRKPLRESATVAQRELRRLDTELARAYKQLAAGVTLLRLAETIKAGGFDLLPGRWNEWQAAIPKLAIARADSRRVWTEGITPHGNVLFSIERTWRNSELSKARDKSVILEGVFDEGNNRERSEKVYAATVPTVPPQFRPARLSSYHVLFEAEWLADPRPADPALLKHVGGDLWAVLATWDLTPLEAAVLGQR